MARTTSALISGRAGRWSALLVMVATAVAVSGCSSEQPKTESKPTGAPSLRPAATPSPALGRDPVQTAKAEAIEAYEQYWKQMERLYAVKEGDATGLEKYAASAALQNAENDAKRAHRRDLVHVGSVVVKNPTATAADIKRKVPNVTLSSCLDISRWQVVNASTKKPVALPTQRLTKFVVLSTVEKWSAGWKVIRDEPQAQAC